MKRWGIHLLAALATLQVCRGMELFDCFVVGEEGCLENNLRQALTRAEVLPTLRLTRHLAIVSNVDNEVDSNDAVSSTLEKLERYLYGHSLKLELPNELVDGARGFVSNEMLNNLPKSLVLPLAEQDANQGVADVASRLPKGRLELDLAISLMAPHCLVPLGVEEFAQRLNAIGRGFIKKVVVPFILGLKFKATAVIPLAMALIALKTWKALTLGLLSLVLTAAMVIFRLTKPKVLNYEVYYPHHHHHVDEHYHGRSASDLAYRAHAQ